MDKGIGVHLHRELKKGHSAACEFFNAGLHLQKTSVLVDPNEHILLIWFAIKHILQQSLLDLSWQNVHLLKYQNFPQLLCLPFSLQVI